MGTKENKEIVTGEKKFTKNSILNSKKFISRKVLLSILLDEEKKYTIKEVEEILEKYHKKVVK